MLQAKLIGLLIIVILIAAAFGLYEYQVAEKERAVASAKAAERAMEQERASRIQKERNLAAVKKKSQASQAIQTASDIVEQQIDDLPTPGIILEGDNAKVARSLIMLFNCNGRGVQQNKGICKQSSGAGVLPGATASGASSVEPVSLDQFFDEVRKGFAYAVEVENEATCYVDSQKK